MKEQHTSRLCVDCKHVVMTSPIGDHAMCGRTVSVVHGGARVFCIHERVSASNCGPSGRFFEPKPEPKASRFLGWLRKVW